MVKKFETYEFDEVGRIIPGKGTMILNFKKLKELLLSKDISRYEELFWQIRSGSKFLDCLDDL